MMLVPKDDHVISYLGPPNHNGYDMWTSYNSGEHAAQIAKAVALGFNTLRVIIPSQPGSNTFQYPTPTSLELGYLTDFYNQAVAAGLKLHLIVFSANTYTDVSGSQSWIASIRSALPADVSGTIRAVEVVGEQRFGISSPPANIGPWNLAIIPTIRNLFPNTPVVIAAGFGLNDLTAAVALLEGTSAQPDWYEWHCYTGVFDARARIQQAIDIVGGNPRRVFIGEAGFDNSASGGGSQSPATLLQAQKDCLQMMRYECRLLGLAEPAVWQLNDMAPSSLFTSGQTFGLYDLGGAAKPAQGLYAQYPPGTHVPPLGLSTTQVAQTDTNSNAVHPRWLIRKGNSGTQPIVSTAVTGGVALSGSGSTTTSDAPGLWFWPVTTPLVTAGYGYTFSVTLAASGSYGTPALGIYFYNSNGGFVSFAGGQTMTLTGTDTRHTIEAVAPANAAQCRLIVLTAANAGTITVKAPAFHGGPISR